MSDDKSYTKNKFELDMPDHDSHAYLAGSYFSLLAWSMPFQLNAKL